MKKLFYLLLFMCGAVNAQTYNPPYGSATTNTTVLGGMDFKNGLGLPDSLTQFSPQKKRIRFDLFTNRIQTYNGTSWDTYASRSDLSGYITGATLESTITYLQNYSNPGAGGITTNIKYGDFGLHSNTTGYNNAAFGPYALYSNTTGSGNSAVGFNALYATTDGNILCAFGNRAGQDFLIGSRNTFLGGYAGGGFQSGSGNIFLTSGTDPSGIVTGNNNTIIGMPTGLASNTSDTVWLGTTAPAFVKDSAGNVNITGSTLKFNGTPVGIGYEAVRNIKTDVTASSNVTGTTGETILKSYTIAANSLDEGVMDLDITLTKSGTANTVVWRVYKNTANSLSGATQIGTYTMPNNSLTAFFHREYTLRGAGIYGYAFVSNALSDDTATSSLAVFGTTFTRTDTNYIIFTAQLTDAADAAGVYTSKIIFSKAN